MLETLAPAPPRTIPLDRTAAARRIVLLGGFGMQPKATMSYRALPLGQQLAARGHAVTIVVPPWDYPEDAGRAWEDHGVRIVNTPIPGVMQTPRIVATLRTTVLAQQPEIVHIFKPKGYSGLVMSLLRGTPVVLDTDDWEGAGGWNDRGLYSAAQQRFFAWQERALPERAAHVTVASRTLETQQWGLGIAPKRVSYLPNALDPIRYAAWQDEAAMKHNAAQIRARLALSGPTILLYTRFIEVSPARIARILACVRESVPDAKLLVVGRDLQGTDGEGVRALAPLGSAVVLAGFIPFAEVPGYIRAADVAVVPFEDTLINRAKSSVKTLDLLAAGQAIVATAVGENTNAIRHNETGVLVPPEDDAALADAVVNLLTDPARARALGEAARARAWREQTWDSQTDTVEAIYARVMAPSVAR